MGRFRGDDKRSVHPDHDKAIKAYWWQDRRNYGDLLTPLLLNRFADVDVEWACPEDAEMIVVGSILEHMPEEWEGTIVGSGKLKEDSKLDLDEAQVLALRGRLSAKGVRGDFALGDPGLLCSEIVPFPTKKTIDLCIVPHWSDKALAERFAHIEPRAGMENVVVDPAADSLTVIGQIAAAEKVVSSSLHGIILADSFHIPRRAERFPNMDKPWEGGEFKWHDYSSVFGTEMQFGEMVQPDERAMERAQKELFDVFRSLSKPRKRKLFGRRKHRHGHRDDD